MRPVSGLAILSLNPSLQMKLTDDYAAGNTDAHQSPVNERYRLFTTAMITTAMMSLLPVAPSNEVSSTSRRKSWVSLMGPIRIANLEHFC
jgi:hypothetical protein